MKRLLIIPSILSANFATLGKDVNEVISAGADILHFDVMDNHYVPNLSIGPMVLKSLMNYGINIPIDVHLMVKPIDRLILEFSDLGVTYISFHPDATDNISRSLKLIRSRGCKAGLVFNPNVTFSSLVQEMVHQLNFIVLMSVNPGFGGQSFMPIVLNKIRQARTLIDALNCQIDLAVDGGINIENVRSISQAGANFFIIGSAIFQSRDIYKKMCVFRSILSIK